MYFQVSIVQYSVYVLVFRTSNNFLYSRQFSRLAKVTHLEKLLFVLLVSEVLTYLLNWWFTKGLLSSLASSFVVDGLVIGLRCLAEKIVVVRTISMWDIWHNFLCSWWFSHFAKLLDCKDCCFPHYLFLILSLFSWRIDIVTCICLSVCLSACLSVPIILVNSVYPMNVPNLQGGEEGVEGPNRYIDS